MFALIIISEYLSKLSEYGSGAGAIGSAMGATTWTLIGGFIAITCGNKCSHLAFEIKKNQNWAYIIGFLFSLLGLLSYWIYYTKKMAQNKR